MLYTDTTDGSPTILHPQFNEYLHSTHGSLQESNHIYIYNGFTLCKELKLVHLLEMGLGSGLNAFLTAIKASENKQSVNYTALELFPLEPGILTNFWDILFLLFPTLSNYKNIQQQLSECPWNQSINITPYFTFTKLNINFLEFQPVGKFDLCYYDAFDPAAQPELWDLNAFSHLASMIHSNGYVVSYCCKGSVKRNLKQQGFAVKKIPGPIGKREFIVATKH